MKNTDEITKNGNRPPHLMKLHTGQWPGQFKQFAVWELNARVG